MRRDGGKGDLLGRWEREPGRTIVRRLEALAREMQYPGHGLDADDLLDALDELPRRAEVVGGRDLRGAPLRGCLVGLELRGWDLSYARLELDFVDCDLAGACFDEATGHGILLLGRLDGASFRRARITASDFRTDSARGACFDGATLTSSRFERADLTNASFRDAKCRHARFAHARVVGADFRRAVLDGADFLDARLNTTTALDGASLTRLNAGDER